MFKHFQRTNHSLNRPFTPSITIHLASSYTPSIPPRRAFLASVCSSVPLVMSAPAALANREYEGIGYLGGSSQVDVNNANVRAYLKMPGMSPSIAGKITSHGPYGSVGDVMNIQGLTSEEKGVIKKYESRLVALKPSPDYVIDRINNGLYR